MTDTARSLASEQGLRDFQIILHAQDTWRALTKVQRRVLREGNGKPATNTKLTEAGLLDDNRTITDWGRFVLEVQPTKELTTP